MHMGAAGLGNLLPMWWCSGGAPAPCGGGWPEKSPEVQFLHFPSSLQFFKAFKDNIFRRLIRAIFNVWKPRFTPCPLLGNVPKSGQNAPLCAELPQVT